MKETKGRGKEEIQSGGVYCLSHMTQTKKLLITTTDHFNFNWFKWFNCTGFSGVTHSCGKQLVYGVTSGTHQC